MNERFGRRRVTGLLLTAGACIGIIVAGILLDDPANVGVLDSEGNEIGQLFQENGELEYTCDDGCESYMDIVRNELLDIVIRTEELSGEKAQKAAAKKIISDKMQVQTACSQEVLNAVEYAYDLNTDPAIGNTAAAVCDIDGRLLACTSRSDNDQNYNYITMPAYAGSSIKPLSVYAPAMEDGTITWSSLYEDSPFALAENADGELEEWPVNTEPYTYRMVPVEDAVATSNNAVAVKVLRKYGAEKSAQFLQESFGIDTGQELELMQEKGADRVLGNLALGYLENGVTVEQIAGAYQIFANGGTYEPAHAITRVTADGENYYQHEQEAEHVISAQTAYIMNRLLRQVVLEGTGTAAQTEGVEVCGKTGTSEYGDHWFAGITPEYTCAVWYEETSTEGTTERSVRIFRDIIAAIDSGEGVEYEMPDGVREAEYCKKTGLLRGETCEEYGTGYFDEEHMPGKCEVCR